MREMDARAIKDFGIPGVVLMENAGKGATEKILTYFPDVVGDDVLIVCGAGNNGGDGFVVARHLANFNCNVRCCLLSDPSKLSDDAKVNFKVVKNMGIEVFILTEEEGLPNFLDMLYDAYLVVDAIFGTGLKKEVAGVYLKAIEAINKSGTNVVSLDVPSGLDADTGNPLGISVEADLTITFALPKVGLLIFPGADYAGELDVVDIGIPQSIYDEAKIDTFLIERWQIIDLFPPRYENSHKGDYGHLFVIAGSTGFTGAATMTCEASARVGAGLVTLGIPKSLNPILENKLLEVMTLPLAETENGSLAHEAFGAIEKACERKTAIAIGPGLGLEPSTQKLVRDVIEKIELPVVVDADGLNALASNVEILLKRKSATILTPHPGEMARLIGSDTQKVKSDRIKVAKEFAKRYGCYVVLKGARSIVAAPEGNIYINPTGNPGMATGGVGDLLTGMIGGFLAEGMNPLESSIAGVYIHGACGDEAALKYGERGMLARDILNEIPKMLRSLEAEAAGIDSDEGDEEL